MKAAEIKKVMFEDFLKWLEENEIDDHFSMDVWMSKAFDLLYARFRESKKFKADRDNLEKSVINLFSSDEIASFSDKRKLLEIKQAEIDEQEKKRIAESKEEAKKNTPTEQ